MCSYIQNTIYSHQPTLTFNTANAFTDPSQHDNIRPSRTSPARKTSAGPCCVLRTALFSAQGI